MNSYRYCGKSLKGAGRKRNEDRWLTRPLDGGGLLLAVADGMGGHPGGDVAAQMIIDSLEHLHFRHGNNIAGQLREALGDADSAIAGLVEKKPELRGMGGTATAAHIDEKRVTWTHIGDSRLYLLRGRRLEQVTSDHTYVQQLVDRGMLTAKEAATHPLANVLEQCIGAMDSGIDSGSFPVEPDDWLFLCSDGIYKCVPEDHLTSIFVDPELSLQEQVDRLLQTVSLTVDHDDATITVVHIE